MEYSTADDIADQIATLREPAITNAVLEKAVKTNPMHMVRIFGENKPHGKTMFRAENQV